MNHDFPGADPWLEQFVNAYAPACPRCRGAIHGTPASRCPNCLARLEVGLTRPSIYSLLWAIMLAGWAAIAGVGLFISIISLRAMTYMSAIELLVVKTQWVACPAALLAVLLSWKFRAHFYAFRWWIKLALSIVAILLATVDLLALGLTLH